MSRDAWAIVALTLSLISMIGMMFFAMENNRIGVGLTGAILNGVALWIAVRHA